MFLLVPNEVTVDVPSELGKVSKVVVSSYPQGTGVADIPSEGFAVMYRLSKGKCVVPSGKTWCIDAAGRCGCDGRPADVLLWDWLKHFGIHIGACKCSGTVSATLRPRIR